MNQNLTNGTSDRLEAVSRSRAPRPSLELLRHHLRKAGRGRWRLARSALGPCLVLAAGLALGCGGAREGEFACGEGSCDLSTELCIVDASDGCGTCVPMPEPCADDTTCDCLLDQDHTDLGDRSCQAQGTCDEAEGLVLTCTPDGWGCG